MEIIILQEQTAEFNLEITQVDTKTFSFDFVFVAASQMQSDWNQTNTGSPDYIQNKPTIPTALAQLTDDATHRLVNDTEKGNFHTPGSDNQDLSGYSLTSHNHSGIYEPANSNIQNHISSKASPHSNVTTLNDGAIIDVNWSTGNVQAITLGGNRTFTFSNGVAGALYQLYIYQDASAPRTITLPNTVKTPGGVLPVLSATNGALDILTFSFNGTNYNLIGFATDVK